MPNSTKLLLLSTIVIFLIAAAGIVAAQETPLANVAEIVALDEDVQPEDLGVGEPRILPDSPFYFLKNWARGIQQVFAFNPVKKAELRMKFANEKLMEAKKMVEQNRNREEIENALQNYQQEIGEMARVAERIRERAEESERVGNFLDKFIQQQTLHQRILQKLENQVPAEVVEKIAETRERHIEKFGEVMTKLEENKEQIRERLEKNLQEVKGSEFKDFKNLEILKQLEEKVPEEAKEAIQKVQESVMERLQENLEKITPEKQEEFKEYLEKVSGEKEKQLEIIENLKTKIKEAPITPIRIELEERLEEGKIKMLERIKKEETPTALCKNLCGDGICQEVVCMAIGCPCPETKETCPADCK